MCDICNNPICTQNCGCKITLGAECVFYNGNATPCLNIAGGTDLATIINRIDGAICALTPSGMRNSVVLGVSGRTSVTSSTIGSTTYYTVDLSNNITNQLSYLNTQVSSINSYLPSTLTTITSSSLTITNPSGHIVNIEAAPTARNYTGITYADYTTHDSNTTSIMINNTQNFITKSSVAVGDKIKYTIVGQYSTFASNPVFTISLLNGSTVLNTNIGSPNTGIGNKNGLIIEITIFVTSSSTGVLNCIWTESEGTAINTSPQVTDPKIFGNRKSVFGKVLTGIDYSNLGVKIEQTAGDTSLANYNLINLFTSEIIKKY